MRPSKKQTEQSQYYRAREPAMMTRLIQSRCSATDQRAFALHLMLAEMFLRCSFDF